MRRGPLAAASAATGLVAVVLLHPGSAKTKVTVSAGGAPSAASASAPAATTPTTTPHSGASQPTTSTAPSAVRSVAGPKVQYGYGELSVQVTVNGSHITAVSVPYLRTAESYSTSIAQYAFPTLRRQVLAAQSARINGVSGATYTSEAYAQSVQAALTKLHL